MTSYALKVNDRDHSVESDDADKPLLYVLRGVGLTAAKYGCGLGQCGSCTVLIDGKTALSCRVTIAEAKGKAITTVEGLRGLHPVQDAFIKGQVPQCGYCTSGIIMSAVELLARKPKPSEADVREALDGNLCRCGSHARVINAVLAASQASGNGG